MLPRLPNENGTININLKRRLQYKGSALSLNVRPHKVFQAAHWLLNNSSLYREEEITLNQNWIANSSYVLLDVNTTISMLPRLPNENGTININLKRRLQYKSPALSLNVRPHKVFQAAHWLLNSGSLYREEEIALNQNWIANSSYVLLDECNDHHLKILHRILIMN